MRKQYLVISIFLCLLAGMLKAVVVSNKTHFPDCTLTVSASTSSESICLGSSASLAATPSNGTAPYTYAWLPTSGLSCTTCQSPVATPTATTTYTVTATDASGCTASSSVAITVNDPPTVNADTLLTQYLTNEPLTATGGVPPYTYTFSPAISSSSLITLLTSTVTTTYTITVTGANGCGSNYNATFVPIPVIKTGACKSIFISEYIQDTLNHDDGIELYNLTPDSINLSSYYLAGTTNGSLYSTPFFIALHGTIGAHATFLIANTNADTSLTHKAKMLSDSLNFGGKDIVTLLQIVVASPNVDFTALDEVGSIIQPPTDSGWAVGLGSTKNHTLVRQTSVVQGDMNWATCRAEWNVYAQGTFAYIGHYQNVCAPKDPYLYLSLGDDSVSCGDPGYFSFDVLIQADSAKNFNDGIFTILFPENEFSGDNLGDGSIQCYFGPDFTPDVNNDYGLGGITQSGNSIYVQIGSTSASPPQGTIVDSIPKALYHFRFKIKNSCAQGYISFDTRVARTWQWVNEDSTFSHLDSTKSTYTTCCPYVCADTAGPYYNYNYHCCDSDTVTNTCIRYCYDSTNLWPVHCYDTTWLYRYDSVYYFTVFGNVDYSRVYYEDSLLTHGCTLNVDAPVKPVNAGTNAMSVPPNSSILYLTGSGFGATPDSVKVSNANGPGMCRLDSMDILSWSENLITIRMPSILSNNHNATPGSGPIQVYNACGGSASSSLRINYNIENSYHSTTNEKTRLNITMSTPANSLVFRCDTSITNNPQAYACVKKAIREWNCYTGVNWTAGPSIILDTTLGDGISTIYFSNNNFTPAIALMKTTQQSEEAYGCYDSQDSLAFYDEADIEIKRNQFISKPWNYDTTYTITSAHFYYFYDVILHELGHALGLGHINDSLSLMYYTTISGHRDSIPGLGYYPGPQTLYGAFDMINTSIAWNPSSLPYHCADDILVTDTRECKDSKLSVADASQNPYNLTLYPNPINYGDIIITYQLNQNSRVQFNIFDCTGRLITQWNYNSQNAGYYKQQINIDNLAGGVYLFTAIINGELKTTKFVKL